MHPSKPRVTVVSFIGKPFAGKDFQGAEFKKRYKGVDVISTGALLRNEGLLAQSGYSESQIAAINDKRNHGLIVDDSVVESLAHQAILNSVKDGNTMIILSGHPRNIHQLKDMTTWEKKQRESGELDITPVYVSFKITARDANRRREQRLQEEGRPDDVSMKAVNTRHWVFRRNVWPMFGSMELSHLFAKGEPLHIIDASQTRDAVTAQLESILQPYLPERNSIEGRVSRKKA